MLCPCLAPHGDDEKPTGIVDVAPDAVVQALPFCRDSGGSRLRHQAGMPDTVEQWDQAISVLEVEPRSGQRTG